MKTLLPITTALLIVLVAGSAAAQDPAPPDTSLPMGPILLGSFGVVTVAVGAGLGWQADQENDDFDKTPTTSLADDVETHALVADILMFGGGALVAGSVLWWLLSDDDEPAPEKVEASAARVTPVVGPGQVGLTAEF
jgi:hypothetical protein